MESGPIDLISHYPQQPRRTGGTRTSYQAEIKRQTKAGEPREKYLSRSGRCLESRGGKAGEKLGSTDISRKSYSVG